MSGDVFNPGDTEPMRKWGAVMIDDALRLSWRGHWVHANGSVLDVSLTYPTNVVNGDVTPLTPLSVYIVWVSKESFDILKSLDSPR